MVALGLAVAVLAVVLPAIQNAISIEVADSSLKQGQRVIDIEASGQTLRPNLQISDVTAYLTDDLSGSITDMDETEPTTGLSGPRVDIALANRGSGSSLVSAVNARVTIADTLQSCIPGGGPLEISTNYDIPIPAATDITLPFLATRQMRFEIKAGELDRFTLTIGPRDVSNGDMPMILITDITLQHDGGLSLSAGTFAMVSAGNNGYLYPKAAGWKIPDIADMASDEIVCYRKNASLVQHVIQRPGLVLSKELRNLDSALTPFR